MHGAVGRVVTAAWGQAFLAPEIDRCYDRNLLWVTNADVSAEVVDAAADRLLGGHGMAHRRLLLEPGPDRALRAALVARGYEAGSHLFMAHAGAMPAAVDGVAVVEAPVDDVLAAVGRYLQRDPDTDYGRDARTREHLLLHHGSYGPAGGAERRFVVRDGDGGDVVAWARLWRREAVAQVEDVVVLEAFRGRGFGRAVVAAATRAALADGAELTFIVADADDWPKELYGRLGFAPIGELGVFQRYAAR